MSETCQVVWHKRFSIYSVAGLRCAWGIQGSNALSRFACLTGGGLIMSQLCSKHVLNCSAPKRSTSQPHPCFAFFRAAVAPSVALGSCLQRSFASARAPSTYTKHRNRLVDPNLSMPQQHLSRLMCHGQTLCGHESRNGDRSSSQLLLIPADSFCLSAAEPLAKRGPRHYGQNV